jgi:preprotein translocase subunit YajC
MLIAAALALGASTAPQGTAGGAPAWSQMIPLLGMVLVFYFLLIRPSQKRQKEHVSMLDALKPGDKVVCAGGIHATVVGVADGTVQVRVADQIRIDVEKSSVTAIRRPPE